MSPELRLPRIFMNGYPESNDGIQRIEYDKCKPKSYSARRNAPGECV